MPVALSRREGRWQITKFHGDAELAVLNTEFVVEAGCWVEIKYDSVLVYNALAVTQKCLSVLKDDDLRLKSRVVVIRYSAGWLVI